MDQWHTPANTPSPDRPLVWLRQTLSRYLTVRSDDIVRRTLNQAFLGVVAALVLLAIAFAATSILLPNGAVILAISLGFLPVLALCGYLARRGSGAGAVLLAGLIAISNAIGFLPTSYADPPVVHVAFVLPALICALFAVPWLGFVGAAAQTAALGVALGTAGVPGPTILTFLIICMLDLLVICVPLVIVAALFRRTVAEQASLAAHLDSEVTQRTAELRQVMRLREQDTTAVIHDINNRMMIVQAEVDELLADALAAGMGSSVAYQAKQRVNGALATLRDLVEDLRTAAQLDNAALTLQCVPLNLAAVTYTVIDQHSTQANLSGCHILVEQAGDPPIIAADTRRIERVLANLLGNAIKYSQQVPLNRRQVRVRVAGTAGWGLVEIADQGPGLDGDSLRRLGAPFTRLDSARGTEGMGVGVYMSKGVVELHGGRLSFSSPGPGQGTIVQIWLPALAPPMHSGSDGEV